MQVLKKVNQKGGEIIEHCITVTTQKLSAIKRLPPILKPIWWALFFIDFAVRKLYGLTLWLLGFWNCHQCGKRYGICDLRYRLPVLMGQLKIRNVTFNNFKRKNICEKCRNNMQEETKALLINDN